jgi:hypothetical protein
MTGGLRRTVTQQSLASQAPQTIGANQHITLDRRVIAYAHAHAFFLCVVQLHHAAPNTYRHISHLAQAVRQNTV